MDQQKHRSQVNAAQLSAAFVLAAGLAFLAAPGLARAGDDSDASSFYNKTFGRVLEGLGLKKSDGDDEIHYRERPPLVLPNGRDLPPPEKSEAVLNPTWPKDPDVKRRKLIEEHEKHRDVEAERLREQNPLPPDQIAPGPRPRNASISTGPGRSGATDFGSILSPSELGYKGGLLGKIFHSKDADEARFTGEPPRTELTDPPPGYQTPSPDQPYGVVGGVKPKAENDYLNRGELKR